MKPEISAEPTIEKEAKIERSPSKDGSLQNKGEIVNEPIAQVDQDKDVNGHKQLAQEDQDENMPEESKAEDNVQPAANT